MGKRVTLITGASMGIGADMARLAAKDECDVVLVARSKEKLDALADELVKAHAVKAWVMAEDLGDRGAPARIEAKCAALGISVDDLVNNAGFGSNAEFVDLPLERELEMIQVNVAALTELSHRFGKKMREKKSGRILNIASTAAFQPGPYMATYYATKAYVLSFSEALAKEMEPHGITVTCYCPGPVATQFAATAGNLESKLFKQGGAAASPEVARDAWESMKAGKVVVVHGFKNSTMAAMVRFTPRPVIRGIVANLNRR